MKLFSFAVAATFLATASFACPSGSLNAGDPPLELTRTDPLFTVSLSKDAAGQITENRQMTRDGAVVDVLTTYTNGLLDRTRTDDRGVIETRYLTDPSGVDLTKVGATFAGATELYFGDTKVSDGTINAEVMATTHLDIGRCRYSISVVRLTSHTEAFAMTAYNEALFATDLGVQVGNVVMDETWKPKQAVLYDQIDQ